MSIRYRPSDISAISAPVTSNNLRNARNRPVIDLGSCTPSQMFSYSLVEHNGTVCIIGNPARGIGIAKAMIRRNQKPFLLIGTDADRQSVFTVLEPEWILDSAQASLPAGNGALLFSRPSSSYVELCGFFEEWSREHFLILHLGRGLQIGPEVLNLLGAVGQCLIFCEFVPQSLRNSESRALSPKEFLSQMNYLFALSAGGVAKDLIELLPTYQYEKVSNSMNVNSYKSRSILHPFHSHRGHGLSWGQTRTMEYKKSLFEMDEMQSLFENGVLLLYVASTNRVFLANLI